MVDEHNSIPEHNQNTTWYGRVRQHILPILPSGYKPKRILDVGSSVGITTLEFSELFPDAEEIIGIDKNPDILSQHQKLFTPEGWSDPTIPKGVRAPPEIDRRKYKLVVAEAPDLPFENDHFDLIVNMNYLYNSASKALREGKGSLLLDEFRSYHRRMTGFLSLGGLYVITGTRKEIDPNLRLEHIIFRKHNSSGKIEEISISDHPDVIEYISEVNS